MNASVPSSFVFSDPVLSTAQIRVHIHVTTIYNVYPLSAGRPCSFIYVCVYIFFLPFYRAAYMHGGLSDRKGVCLSVRPSVRLSVCPSVRHTREL